MIRKLTALAAPDMPSLSKDKLRGIAQIADYIGESERRTFYLCEKRLIPCGKEGANWIAFKSILYRHYQRLAGGDESA